MSDTGFSRRRFLRLTGWTGAAIGVPLATGYAGYRIPRSDATPSDPAAEVGKTDVHHFVSRPDLRPPRLTVTNPGASPDEPEYLFLSPKAYQDDSPSDPGLLIADRRGQPVWFLPSPGEDSVPNDFKVQTYRGEPVLTWWQGTVDDGHGQGMAKIYDTAYREIAEVGMGNGVQSDLHEVLLTERDTALLMGYEPKPADLSPVDGDPEGWVYAGIVQEVDVETGEVVFEWNSLDHVRVEETHHELEDSRSEDQPFDYIHLNSIEPTDDGNLLLSARNTCALYKISWSTGEVIWRLHGKESDFSVADDARFYWQHDARVHSGDRIALFDNASSPPRGPHSRGLILQLDTAEMRVTVQRELAHPAGLLSDNQGSMQLLSDERSLVGWGSQPYTSEFDEEGELTLDIRFPEPDQSYRARVSDWSGVPDDRPAVGIGRNMARGVTVYVSWNGATGVHQWRVLAGEDEDALEPIATADRTGFETAIAVNNTGPYFVAVALDEEGEPLGRSEPAHHEE